MNAFWKVPPLPSSVWTRIEYWFLVSKSNTALVFRVEPSIVNDALSSSPVPLTSV